MKVPLSQFGQVVNTMPFTPHQLLHFNLLSCMQEAVFGPFFLASKLNVAGSIPVTRFQKPLRMALKTVLRRYNECASREALCLANLPDSGKVVTEGQSFGMRPRIFRGKLM